MDALAGFHPAIRTWFGRRFPDGPDGPAGARLARDRRRGGHADRGAHRAPARRWPPSWSASTGSSARWPPSPTADLATEVVYVSPLKALAADIRENLERPLAEIRDVARELGLAVPDLRVVARTGDTTPTARAAMLRQPPHLLITTPESLYLLVTAARSRERLRGVRTVIVDEIHAVARDKRGSHLALTLERLEALGEAPGPSASGCRPPSGRSRRSLASWSGPARGAAGPTATRRAASSTSATAVQLDLTIELPGQRAGSRRVPRAVGRDPGPHRRARAGTPHDARSSSTPGVWPSGSRTSWASASGRARSPPITAACPRIAGSGSRRGSAPASWPRWSPRRRSSSASTSGPSSSCARSGPRAASRRSLQRVGRSGHARGAVAQGTRLPDDARRAGRDDGPAPRRARRPAGPRPPAATPRSMCWRSRSWPRAPPTPGPRTSSSSWSGARRHTRPRPRRLRRGGGDAVGRHPDRARTPGRVPPPRPRPRHPAGPAERPARRADVGGRHPGDGRLPRRRRPGRHDGRHRQRGLGDREHAGRRVPSREHVLADPSRRGRARAGGRRRGRAAHCPLLARGGAGAYRGGVGCRVGAPRDAGRAARDRRHRRRRGLARARGRRRHPGRDGGRAIPRGRARGPRRPPDPAPRRLRALLRRGGRDAARRPRALRRPDQPRPRARAPEALLPALRLRAPGRGQRRRGRALPRPRAKLPARRTCRSS